ncbi:class I SAM-dependent methyltransferase [Legionella septentrionalis]|uniref:class I SAM-dependent methyltransferase n=1 Tax=Legionella septentrionalis TaxID=2498109 RepID=UPI000F8CD6BE|nr:class I SAM-dependent methyltransferase [Legionella septentrionalis]RUR17122.1 class I SAM-dependent methyltransferase [Legionella septentrionalis]
MSWDPEEYKSGNYFQKETSDAFCKNFNIVPYGNILDIGCGDGAYSHALANKLMQGHIHGIDSSIEMIHHAVKHWTQSNLSFAVHDIETFYAAEAFDFALSFWCLHWTRIELSLPNIFYALKPGGKFYAIFSSFSGNSISQVWHELMTNCYYRDLTKQYVNSDNSLQNYFLRVIRVLAALPYKQIRLNLHNTHTLLPSIAYFKNLLLTMPFMKSFPEEIMQELLEAMLDTFQAICKRRYGGQLYYATRPIFLEAIK